MQPKPLNPTAVKIIHFAMVAAVALYGFIMGMMEIYVPMPKVIDDPELLTMLGYGAAGFCLLLFALLPVLREFLLGKMAIDASEPFAAVEKQYLTQLFILWAVVDFGAIAGVVVYLLGTDLSLSLISIGLSMVLMALQGARQNERDQLRTKYDALQ